MQQETRRCLGCGAVQLNQEMCIGCGQCTTKCNSTPSIWKRSTMWSTIPLRGIPEAGPPTWVKRVGRIAARR